MVLVVAATLRLEAKDQGVVLKHGDGPAECDRLGARDVWVFEAGRAYPMHYDGAGPKGWLACLATSPDLVHRTKKGPILDFGKPGADGLSSAFHPRDLTLSLISRLMSATGSGLAIGNWTPPLDRAYPFSSFL